MSEDDKNNLVNFLKLFKNRPYHLAKYLMDNSALTTGFLRKISNSDRLRKPNTYFDDISEMNEFYDSLLDINISNKSSEEIAIEMNSKMNDLIIKDRFEEAAKLRDYMIKNKIKRHE